MTFPGPDALGRGLVVVPGADLPAGWDAVERVRVDAGSVSSPSAALALLQPAWCGRRRVVVELAVDAGELRAPESERRPPYSLSPSFELARERLHFLVWANTYDARRPGHDPVWWHAVRAVRLEQGASPGGPADVVLADGRPAWCDGGPRQPVALPDGEAVIHRDSVDAGRLTVGRDAPPSTELAPDQLAAVTHPGGPARIIAPAGSGKTRVLTERLRHLLVDRGHEPELLTAVAYNVKAADELRGRTQGLNPTVRTLNSLGLSICQMVGGPKVIEERDVRNLLESIVKVRHRVNSDPIAPYIDALSLIRLGLVDPEEAEARIPDAAGVATAFPTYRALLAERNLADFDEQIYRALSICLADPGVRARARATARTLLVDEFQDLTPAHVLLIRLLAGPAGSVFGVGDDDQVIYGYAGADPGFLIDFGRYFPGSASYDLTVNYRCPPAVVSSAARLLGYNRRRLAKRIDPAPGREEIPGELDVRCVPNLTVAARDQVASWLEDGSGEAPAPTAPTAPTDVAVLARVNSVLLPIQVLLTEAGIPCTRAVGPEVLSRTGSAAALAYLRMGLRPDAIDRADVASTVRRPSRKIAKNVLDMMTRRPLTSVTDLTRLAEWLSGDDSDRVAAYVDDIELVADAASRGTTAAALAAIRTKVGLETALEALDSSRGAVDRSAHGDDLWALEQVAALHPDPATFEDWLRRAIAAAAGEGVHLSTVHKVKGREWPFVVVFAASAGLFPHRLSDDVEEERRVFHVAVTRARRGAVVLADATAPSPFLDELAGVAAQPAVAPPRVRAETPAARGARGGAAPPVELTGAAAAVFEALRAWRTDQARREKMPPYVIMSDAHLRGIAARVPTTLVSLARCPGIGPVKLERYGDDILRVLEKAAGAT